MAGPTAAEIDEGIKMLSEVIKLLPRESAAAAELAGRLATIATLRDAHLKALRAERTAANVTRERKLIEAAEEEMGRTLEYASQLRQPAAEAVEILRKPRVQPPKRAVGPSGVPTAASVTDLPAISATALGQRGWSRNAEGFWTRPDDPARYTSEGARVAEWTEQFSLAFGRPPSSDRELLLFARGAVPATSTPPAMRIVRAWQREWKSTALATADARVLASAEAEAEGQLYMLTIKLRPEESQYGRVGPHGGKLWEARVRVPLEHGEKARFRPDLPGVSVSQTGDTLYGYYGTEIEARQAAEEMMLVLVEDGLKIRVTAGTWRPMSGGWFVRSVDGATYGVIRNTPAGRVWYVARRGPAGEVVVLERGPAVGTLEQQRNLVNLALGGR